MKKKYKNDINRDDILHAQKTKRILGVLDPNIKNLFNAITLNIEELTALRDG